MHVVTYEQVIRFQFPNYSLYVHNALYVSGVTRVGVTRGGTWGCHPYFFLAAFY